MDVDDGIITISDDEDVREVFNDVVSRGAMSRFGTVPLRIPLEKFHVFD